VTELDDISRSGYYHCGAVELSFDMFGQYGAADAKPARKIIWQAELADDERRHVQRGDANFDALPLRSLACSPTGV
jgi:hypothetical protein